MGLKWQYLRMTMGQFPAIEHLDSLGAQGWEAVQKELMPGQINLYEWLFKRAVLEHPMVLETAQQDWPQGMPQERPPVPAMVQEAAIEKTKELKRTKGEWSPEARERARQRYRDRVARAARGEPATQWEQVQAEKAKQQEVVGG